MTTATLEEFLSATDGLSEATETAGTLPENDDSEAAKALRELGRLERMAAANSAMAAQERTKITEWETEVNTPIQNRANRLRAMLEGYAVLERTRDESRKTISTPFGTIKTTPKQPVWVIDDEIFIQWAMENAPELVKTTRTPEKAKLKAAYQRVGVAAKDPISGDEVAGVEIIDAPEKYSITIKTN